jgi:hypothetical protein
LSNWGSHSIENRYISNPEVDAMPKSIPYQPLILRLVHGVSGFLAIGALITGFWVYNTYDGRFGTLKLPELYDAQGVHGTFGLFFLISFTGLAIYSLYWGSRRLLFPDFWRRLWHQPGQPVWWVNLQRLVNSLMLLAALLAVISGRMMQESWLPFGETHHLAYQAHLLGWLVLLISLMLHLVINLKVGGVPLLVSMVQWGYRPEESPALWWQTLRQRFRR